MNGCISTRRRLLRCRKKCSNTSAVQRHRPGGKHEIRKAAVRSAITHMYFESIHPFKHANGRIGRALSENALSQGLGQPALLSLSRVIEARKKEYYDALKEGQQSNEITSWVSWFINTALEAQIQAEEQIDFTLKKTKLFDRFRNQLNDRHCGPFAVCWTNGRTASQVA